MRVEVITVYKDLSFKKGSFHDVAMDSDGTFLVLDEYGWPYFAHDAGFGVWRADALKGKGYVEFVLVEE